jgi:polyhydroxyalkanoate synthesis regulator phasin
MINDLNEVNWCYLLDPTFELINSAGKPLTDGWIEVYIHGTRSKYYCASDFDGTLHPFKIPLDSLGANIVLASPAHAYDVYVYNKYGSLVMSRYNVVPATGDAEVITDTTVITSNDGTVQVASSDQTNWDLSIADTIAPVTADVDEHDRQITQIEHDISDIQSVLSNKKDKQAPYSSEGGVTQTITKVEQDSNGNINVTYSDIDLPPEVPTVEITSPNGTMNIASSIDVETNTKTFEIDVKNSDPVWHYWTGRNAWTYITSKSWTQINRPAIGAGSNPHSWNPTIKRGIYDTKAHFTVTFHNADNSKTVPNQIIQVGFRAKFVGKNDPTAIRYEDLGAWTYDPTLYSDEPYEYNFAQSSMRQNNDTSCILNVANYWGDTEFDVFFEAALINTDGEDSGPSPIDTVLMAEITYFGYHEIKGTVQSTSGGGREYSEGSGIDITDDTISVKAGEGLTFDEGKLVVDFDEVNEHQVQSDWNQTASAEPDFIKNKPDLSGFATKTELSSAVDILEEQIHNLPQDQVQSDWDETDVDDPAYIQNKPDLSVYATKDELGSAIEVVNTNIATAVDVVETHLSSAVDIIEQQIGEIPAQVQSDWTENDSADPAFIQHKPAEKTLKAGAHITITDVGTAVEIASEGEPQVQSNWNENNSSSPAYIKNKPDLSTYATVTALGSAVDAIEQQIQNIPEQEQSNWTETNTSDPSFIKNKPSTCPLVAGQNITITDQGSAIEISSAGGGGGTQVQADWAENDSSDPSYIKNKPDLSAFATDADLASAVDVVNDNIASAVDVLQNEIEGIPTQVQSDWTEDDSTDPSFIQNKPSTTPLIAGQNVTITDVGSGIQIDAAGGTFTQVQSDWTEDDPQEPSFIQNKPTEKNLVAGAGVTISETNDDVIVETTEIASGAQLVAGSGIDIQESNGQVVISSTGGGGSFTQEQSNWNESDTTSPAFILNKPTIPEDKVIKVNYGDYGNTFTADEFKNWWQSGKFVYLYVPESASLPGNAPEGLMDYGPMYLPLTKVGAWENAARFSGIVNTDSDEEYIVTLIYVKSSRRWLATYTKVVTESDIPSTTDLATKTELASAIDIVEADIPADKLFIAEYNVTTYNEIWAAMNAGKVAVLERHGTSELHEPFVRVYGIIEKQYRSIDDDGIYLYVDEVEKSGDDVIARRYTLSVPSGQSDYSTWSVSYIRVTPSSYATKTELGTVESSIPTNTSDLNNDSGFITSSDLTDLASKTELASAIDIVEAEIPDLNDLNTAGITDIQIVNALPASPVATVLYLVRE